MVKKKDDLDFEEAFDALPVEEESTDLSSAEKLQLEAEAKAEVARERSLRLRKRRNTKTRRKKS